MYMYTIACRNIHIFTSIYIYSHQQQAQELGRQDLRQYSRQRFNRYAAPQQRMQGAWHGMARQQQGAQPGEGESNFIAREQESPHGWAVRDIRKWKSVPVTSLNNDRTAGDFLFLKEKDLLCWTSHSDRPAYREGRTYTVAFESIFFFFVSISYKVSFAVEPHMCMIYMCIYMYIYIHISIYKDT